MSSATLTAPPPAAPPPTGFIAPQAPTIRCAICFHNELRIVTATHFYLGLNNTRVHCCTACVNHLRRLSVTVPTALQSRRPLN